jgi:hypothetical protein
VGEEELELVVDKAAEEELAAAVSWYEKRRIGVGRLPWQQSRQPLSWYSASQTREREASEWEEGCVWRGFRSRWFTENCQTIYVVAVAHDKRRPGYWKNR